MFSWIRKQKLQCTEADARFLILLCLGRTPYVDAECDIYTDMSIFGAAKRLLASRAFGQTVLDPFTMGQGTLQFALDDAQTGLMTHGLKKYFDIETSAAKTNRWPNCLTLALDSRRFQKAFLSEHSPDKLKFLQDNLKQFQNMDAGSYHGAVHQASGTDIRGIAYKAGQTAPLSLVFYLNGLHAGTTKADQINREIGEHLSTDGTVAFECRLHLDASLKRKGDVVLHVFDQTSGVMVCPPREVCLSPAYGAALLNRITHDIDALEAANTNNEMRIALDAVSARLPALEQIATFSLDDYSLYCRTYSVGPPDETSNLTVAVMVTGKGTTEPAQTLASIKHQSHPHVTFVHSLHEARNFDIFVQVPAGDILHPHAAAWFAASAQKNPGAVIIRASSDQIAPDNTRIQPDFAWQFDPLILAQKPAYARTYAVRTSGLNTTNDDAATLWQDIYRTHGDAGFALVEGVIWSCANKPTQKLTPLKLPKPQAHKKLAIIIPTKDALSLLKPCIESLHATIAHPRETEIIIVDNNSEEPETKQWLKEIVVAGSQTDIAIRTITDNQSFNWARINNTAVRYTDADYLLFLNNDTLAIDRGWDTVMRGLLETDDISVVGAKLLYSDNTIQHAGVVLDKTSLALHEGAGAEKAARGYADRHVLTRRCAAVTGAFLACRRADFLAVDGFDAENFAVTFNDIDFCLRMNACGQQCVYTSLICFYHLESKSRGYDGVSPGKAARAKAEHNTLRAKWPDPVQVDPWYPTVFDTQSGKAFSVLRRPVRASSSSFS